MRPVNWALNGLRQHDQALHPRLLHAQGHGHDNMSDAALNFSAVDAGTASLSEQSRQAMDQWLSDVSSQTDAVNAQLKDQLTKVEASSASLQTDIQAIQDQALEVSSSSESLNGFSPQLESGLNQVKAESEPAVAQLQTAADATQDQLAQTAADSAGIGQGVSEGVQQAAAPMKPAFAQASAAGENANAAQSDLLAQVSAGNSEMGQAIADAQAQADDLTAQAQAQVDQAQATVASVQSDVGAARQDVVAAETIVDEEVVKRGGESKMLAVQSPAAPAQTSPKAAAQDGPADGGLASDAPAEPATSAKLEDAAKDAQSAAPLGEQNQATATTDDPIAASEADQEPPVAQAQKAASPEVDASDGVQKTTEDAAAVEATPVADEAQGLVQPEAALEAKDKGVTEETVSQEETVPAENAVATEELVATEEAVATEKAKATEDLVANEEALAKEEAKPQEDIAVAKVVTPAVDAAEAAEDAEAAPQKATAKDASPAGSPTMVAIPPAAGMEAMPLKTTATPAPADPLTLGSASAVKALGLGEGTSRLPSGPINPNKSIKPTNAKNAAADVPKPTPGGSSGAEKWPANPQTPPPPKPLQVLENQAKSSWWERLKLFFRL